LLDGLLAPLQRPHGVALADVPRASDIAVEDPRVRERRSASSSELHAACGPM